MEIGVQDTEFEEFTAIRTNFQDNLQSDLLDNAQEQESELSSELSSTRTGYAPMKDLKTLSIEVWAKKWDEDIDLTALVEEACMEAGLNQICADIAEWTSVESGGPTTLVLDGDRIEYKARSNKPSASSVFGQFNTHGLW